MKFISRHVWMLILVCSLGTELSAQDFSNVTDYKAYPDSEVFFDSTKRFDPAVRGMYIRDGDKTVFEFYSNNAGDPGNHSTCDSRLVFEIGGSKKKFHLKDDALFRANAMYGQLCRSGDRGYQRIHNGWIKGEKLNNGTWEIEMDVRVIGRVSGKTYLFKSKAVYNDPDN